MFSMTLWRTFAEALNQSVKRDCCRQMLAKINFPREGALLASWVKIFFNFAIKLNS